MTCACPEESKLKGLCKCWDNISLAREMADNCKMLPEGVTNIPNNWKIKDVGKTTEIVDAAEKILEDIRVQLAAERVLPATCKSTWYIIVNLCLGCELFEHVLRSQLLKTYHVVSNLSPDWPETPGLEDGSSKWPGGISEKVAQSLEFSPFTNIPREYAYEPYTVTVRELFRFADLHLEDLKKIHSADAILPAPNPAIWRSMVEKALLAAKPTETLVRDLDNTHRRIYQTPLHVVDACNADHNVLHAIGGTVTIKGDKWPLFFIKTKHLPTDWCINIGKDRARDVALLLETDVWLDHYSKLYKADYALPAASIEIWLSILTTCQGPYSKYLRSMLYCHMQFKKKGVIVKLSELQKEPLSDTPDYELDVEGLRLKHIPKDWTLRAPFERHSHLEWVYTEADLFLEQERKLRKLTDIRPAATKEIWLEIVERASSDKLQDAVYLHKALLENAVVLKSIQMADHITSDGYIKMETEEIPQHWCLDVYLEQRWAVAQMIKFADGYCSVLRHFHNAKSCMPTQTLEEWRELLLDSLRSSDHMKHIKQELLKTCFIVWDAEKTLEVPTAPDSGEKTRVLAPDSGEEKTGKSKEETNEEGQIMKHLDFVEPWMRSVTEPELVNHHNYYTLATPDAQDYQWLDIKPYANFPGNWSIYASTDWHGRLKKIYGAANTFLESVDPGKRFQDKAPTKMQWMNVLTTALISKTPVTTTIDQLEKQFGQELDAARKATLLRSHHEHVILLDRKLWPYYSLTYGFFLLPFFILALLAPIIIMEDYSQKFKYCVGNHRYTNETYECLANLGYRDGLNETYEKMQLIEYVRKRNHLEWLDFLASEPCKPPEIWENLTLSLGCRSEQSAAGMMMFHQLELDRLRDQLRDESGPFRHLCHRCLFNQETCNTHHFCNVHNSSVWDVLREERRDFVDFELAPEPQVHEEMREVLENLRASIEHFQVEINEALKDTAIEDRKEAKTVEESDNTQAKLDDVLTALRNDETVGKFFKIDAVLHNTKEHINEHINEHKLQTYASVDWTAVHVADSMFDAYRVDEPPAVVSPPYQSPCGIGKTGGKIEIRYFGEITDDRWAVFEQTTGLARAPEHYTLATLESIWTHFGPYTAQQQRLLDAYDLLHPTAKLVHPDVLELALKMYNTESKAFLDALEAKCEHSQCHRDFLELVPKNMLHFAQSIDQLYQKPRYSAINLYIEGVAKFAEDTIGWMEPHMLDHDQTEKLQRLYEQNIEYLQGTDTYGLNADLPVFLARMHQLASGQISVQDFYFYGKSFATLGLLREYLRVQPYPYGTGGYLKTKFALQILFSEEAPCERCYDHHVSEGILNCYEGRHGFELALYGFDCTITPDRKQLYSGYDFLDNYYAVEEASKVKRTFHGKLFQDFLRSVLDMPTDLMLEALGKNLKIAGPPILTVARNFLASLLTTDEIARIVEEQSYGRALTRREFIHHLIYHTIYQEGLCIEGIEIEFSVAAAFGYECVVA